MAFTEARWFLRFSGNHAPQWCVSGLIHSYLSLYGMFVMSGIVIPFLLFDATQINLCGHGVLLDLVCWDGKAPHIFRNLPVVDCKAMVCVSNVSGTIAIAAYRKAHCRRLLKADNSNRNVAAKAATQFIPFGTSVLLRCLIAVAAGLRSSWMLYACGQMCYSRIVFCFGCNFGLLSSFHKRWLKVNKSLTRKNMRG